MKTLKDTQKVRICKFCGTKFYRYISPNQEKIGWGLFCSQGCRGKAIGFQKGHTLNNGKNHPNWQGGAENKLFRFGGNREKALQRDGCCCVLCGMTNNEHLERWERSITVDHIDNKGRYSKEKNHNLDNLVTLCLRCHGKKDGQKRSPRPIIDFEFMLKKVSHNEY